MYAVKPVLPAGVQVVAKTAVAGIAIGIRNAVAIRYKSRVFLENSFFNLVFLRK